MSQVNSCVPTSLSSIAYIIAVISKISSAKPEGYRIVAVSGLKNTVDVRDVPYNVVVEMLKRGSRLENAELDKNLDVHITQGSYKIYPKIDASTGALRGRNGLTVLYGVSDEGGTTVGFGVVDASGTIGNVSYDRLLRLTASYTPTNWEVYTKDAGDRHIRLKSGTLQKVILRKKAVVQSITSKVDSAEVVRAKEEANKIALEQLAQDNKASQERVAASVTSEAVNKAKLAESEAFKKYDAALKALDEYNESLTKGTFVGNIDAERERLNENLSEALKEYQLKCQEARDGYIFDSGAATALPAVTISGLVDSSIHPNIAKNANTKMVQVANNLNFVSPYYGSMFSAIPKQMSMAVSTMAVSEKDMLINPSFLMQLPLSEATFIYIHEMLHIALQHAARHGKHDNVLWNIACDIYINELICRDFGVTFGDDKEKIFDVTGSNGKSYKGVLKCPSFGCFLSTVGETLDFSKDTEESIYRRLYEENKNSPQQNGGQSGQDGQSGQQGDANGQGGNQSGQGGSQDGQSGQSGSQSSQSGQGGQSEGAKGQSGQQDTQSNSTNDQGDTNQGTWENVGSQAKGDSTLQDDIANSNIDDYRCKTISREIIYKGKKMAVTTTMDVVTDKKVADSERPNETSFGAAREAITRIITKRKLDITEGKKSFSLTSGEELVERSMDFALASMRDWRVILRKMANKKPKKTYNINNPDRKLMNMGVTVASRQPIGKKTAITGIKICIDVSGSVSEVELNRHFTLIAQILHEYNVEAEMIYWDTQITNVGNFNDLKSMLKIKPLGCGGTDVKCVFDFLTKRTKFKGMVEETSVKDIPCVLIFTDGCFRHNYEEYARYFGKKLVWVIDEAAPPFKPLFGVVAKDKLS